MSFSSLLREVNALSEARAERVRCWADQGHAVSLSPPQHGARLLGFTAHRKRDTWQGLIDPREWLAHALPGLESLLPAGCADRDIQQLFEVARSPLQLPIDCLRYRRLSEVHLLDAADERGAPCPVVQTGLGRVWITRLPPAPRPSALPIPNWLRALPSLLVWRLGSSPMSSLDLARLGCGDVLQIVDRDWEVLCSRRRIGRFRFTHEGLKMNSATEQPAASSDEPIPSPPVNSASEGQLAMRVEFVLHEQTCTLAEIAALVEGKVLPLSADSAREVQVRLNGHWLATGELVRWEDQLGVQLHTVRRSGA